MPSARVVVAVLMAKLSSSVRMSALALFSPDWMLPPVGALMRTCRVSLLSRMVSPATWIVRV